MQKLTDFYTKSLLAMAGAIVPTVALVHGVIVPFIAPFLYNLFPAIPWSEKLASGLTSGAVIGFVLAAGEWLIRKKLWKLVHPELNFSGRWIGHTKYTHVRIGKTKKPVPFKTQQEVVIVQDCLSLRLLPSEGLDFKAV